MVKTLFSFWDCLLPHFVFYLICILRGKHLPAQEHDLYIQNHISILSLFYFFFLTLLWSRAGFRRDQSQRAAAINLINWFWDVNQMRIVPVGVSGQHNGASFRLALVATTNGLSPFPRACFYYTLTYIQHRGIIALIWWVGDLWVVTEEVCTGLDDWLMVSVNEFLLGLQHDKLLELVCLGFCYTLGASSRTLSTVQ